MFCCTHPGEPAGGREDTSYDGCLPAIRIPGKVLKGASQRKRSPLNRTVHTRWQAAKSRQRPGSADFAQAFRQRTSKMPSALACSI